MSDAAEVAPPKPKRRSGMRWRRRAERIPLRGSIVTYELHRGPEVLVIAAQLRESGWYFYTLTGSRLPFIHTAHEPVADLRELQSRAYRWALENGG